MKTAKPLVQVALFVALMVVGAWINVTVIPDIPFTLQTFFALLAGLVLGRRAGALSQVIYLALGLAGLPVFAQFRGGIQSFLSPTFGFLLGFILGAFLCGWIAARTRFLGELKSALLGALGGMAAIYLSGIAYFYILSNEILHTNLSIFAIIMMMAPFLIPDALKMGAAAVIGTMIRKRLKDHGLMADEKE